MTGQPARVLLADDHPVVRHGLREILDAEADLRRRGRGRRRRRGGRAGAARRRPRRCSTSTMPRMTGLQAAAELSRRRPELRVLMLSMHDNEQYLFEALRAGASGYVLKTAADRDLVEACRAAMRGETFLYPAAVSGLVRDFLERARAGETRRPAHAARARGRQARRRGPHEREIAEMLDISGKTVDRHRENILEKLGMRDRVELTRYAIRRGLVEP